jgi:GntR family transcriptional regulator, transcriptional repressor for pyruvate dehydrogenase complex
MALRPVASTAWFPTPGGLVSALGSGPPRATGLPTTLLPVRRSTAVDEVTDRLVTAVALGSFLPGERLPVERELCSLLGVSRSTVRQALARLRAAGVIEVRRGRSGGAYVNTSWTAASAGAVRRTLQPQLSELELLFDLRARVEEMVARAAAEQRSAEDVQALEAAMAAFASAEEPTEEHRRDGALHETVLAATGNPLLAELSRDLLSRTTVGVPREPYRKEVFARAVHEHAELISAVVAGDVPRAGAVARAHFAMSAEALREILARGLADGAPGAAGPGPPRE